MHYGNRATKFPRFFGQKSGNIGCQLGGGRRSGGDSVLSGGGTKGSQAIDRETELCDGRFVVRRRQIEKAIERNVPFVLKMADGNEYRVPHRDFIALPPKAAYVIVFDAEGKSFDVLPLLTMTGLHQSGDGIGAHSAE